MFILLYLLPPDVYVYYMKGGLNDPTFLFILLVSSHIFDAS